MRFERVLLISPDLKNKRYDPYIPVGLGCIAQALSDAKIDYDVIDMFFGRNRFFLWSRLKNFKPDLVGLSMFTLYYKTTYKLIRFIKKVVPWAKIIIGGPHISSLREQVLEECREIDYGIVLTGEEAIVELCKGKMLQDIKGLVYRQDTKVLFNGLRPLPKNLDRYSFPRYNKFKLNKYWFGRDVPMPLVSSRGCPYQCIFCISRPSGGDKFYTRSANNVVDEIQYWHTQGRAVFDFLDDNFTLDRERVYLICDEIERRDLNKLEYRLTNGIRADTVDRKLLCRMREVGFKTLAFGVESASDRVLKIIKKGESIAQIEEAVKNACELGYDVILYFLVGLPFETQDDLNASFNFASRYPVFEALFFNIIPMPKTELYEWVCKNNFFIYPPQRYLNTSQINDKRPVFQTPELPFRERRKALKYANSISKKIKIRYYQKFLSKYGIFARLFSFLATSNFVRKRLMYVPIIKKSLRFTKRVLISK